MRSDDKLSRNYPANYDAHARSVAADAYWNQVRRTVSGEPVDEAQIALIVDAIIAGLCLTATDVVVDLACGNGALSSRLFNKCAGLVGVDISPYLIEIANKDFARPPNFRFHVQDAVSYLGDERDTSVYSKALLYGAFQYFSRDDATLVLTTLNEKFPRVTRVFIGNLPDKTRVSRFYRDRIPGQAELNDHEAQIGVWYFPEELIAIGLASGWRASISHMPSEFYASSYRFDVTLERF